MYDLEPTPRAASLSRSAFRDISVRLAAFGLRRRDDALHAHGAALHATVRIVRAVPKVAVWPAVARAC